MVEALILFSIILAAAAGEVYIFYRRIRRAAIEENNRFSDEFQESFSYLEDPDGMDRDLKNLLAEENAKAREESMDMHPSKPMEKLAFDVEHRQVIGYVSEEIEKAKKRRKNPGPRPPSQVVWYWDLDK